MIKINRIYTEIETENALDKEYRDYYVKNRRVFYIDDEALNRFKEAMQTKRQIEAIDKINNIVKNGYVSQHWR